MRAIAPPWEPARRLVPRFGVRGRCYLLSSAVRTAGFPGVLRRKPAELRQPGGARVRQDPRLLRRAVGVRAQDVRARGRAGRPLRRGLHARLLPSGAGPVRRDHGHEADARDEEEPQAPQAPRALSRRPDQALLQARYRAPGRAIPTRARLLAPGDRVGEIYLTAGQIAARVAQLGREIAVDYAEQEPLLVAALKASMIFAADLSRAIPIVHQIDYLELAGYAGAATGGHTQIRLP